MSLAEEEEDHLVGWYFEPSQPGLKTYFDLSPSYSIHKSKMKNGEKEVEEEEGEEEGRRKKKKEEE